MGSLKEDEIAFIEYIENTLVPDLRESGSDATADDFERLVGIIDRLTNTKTGDT